MTCAGAEFWDHFFRQRRESGHDLDWGGVWTGPFLVPVREARVRTILELGCGTGHDAARLAGEGYSVAAVDLSGEAIDQAQARFGSMVRFVVADMTQRLPFCDGGSGLFLFHVNALEDRPLRARWQPARA